MGGLAFQNHLIDALCEISSFSVRSRRYGTARRAETPNPEYEMVNDNDKDEMIMSDKYLCYCLQQEVWEGSAGREGRNEGHSSALLCTVFIADPEP